MSMRLIQITKFHRAYLDISSDFDHYHLGLSCEEDGDFKGLDLAADATSGLDATVLESNLPSFATYLLCINTLFASNL